MTLTRRAQRVPGQRPLLPHGRHLWSEAEPGEMCRGHRTRPLKTRKGASTMERTHQKTKRDIAVLPAGGFASAGGRALGPRRQLGAGLPGRGLLRAMSNYRAGRANRCGSPAAGKKETNRTKPNSSKSTWETAALIERLWPPETLFPHKYNKL